MWRKSSLWSKACVRMRVLPMCLPEPQADVVSAPSLFVTSSYISFLPHSVFKGRVDFPSDASRERYAEFLKKKGSLLDLEHVKTDSFEQIKGLGRGAGGEVFVSMDW